MSARFSVRNSLLAFQNLRNKFHKDHLGSTTILLEEDETRNSQEADGRSRKRRTWDRPVEFLFACISMSVGLGNVWRFPVSVYENGGGAFIIPYIFVVLIIKKPIYLMELVFGQFSSSGPVKIWRSVPISKGVGYGQAIASVYMLVYYASLVAMAIFYLISSFQTIPPWSVCKPEWRDMLGCYDSDSSLPVNISPNRTVLPGLTVKNGAVNNWDALRNRTVLSGPSGNNNRSESETAKNWDLLRNAISKGSNKVIYSSSFFVNDSTTNTSGMMSSDALFFRQEAVNAVDNIDGGIGAPSKHLSGCLLLTWIIIFLMLSRGLKSSGKAAYVTVLFPFAGLIILLVRGLSFGGATEGILFFLKPDWSKLVQMKTWYEAVTQCFFSLASGTGPVIAFSSRNTFNRDIYRDSWTVTFVDLATSFLAGITTFALLGNLAYASGRSISELVVYGPNLAFISIPAAISKYAAVPQFFAVSYYLVLLMVGIGSCAGIVFSLVTIICDQFAKLRKWIVTAVVCALAFALGLATVTPGSMFVQRIINYFGTSFILFILAFCEVCSICYIYGINRFVRDTHFLLGKELGKVWILSVTLFIPTVLLALFIETLVNYTPLRIGDYVFPTSAMGVGWFLSALALIQPPLWAIISVYRQPGATLAEKFQRSLQPTEDWGPAEAEDRVRWKRFIGDKSQDYSRFPRWLRIVRDQ